MGVAQERKSSGDIWPGGARREAASEMWACRGRHAGDGMETCTGARVGGEEKCGPSHAQQLLLCVDRGRLWLWARGGTWGGQAPVAQPRVSSPQQ